MPSVSTSLSHPSVSCRASVHCRRPLGPRVIFCHVTRRDKMKRQVCLQSSPVPSLFPSVHSLLLYFVSLQTAFGGSNSVPLPGHKVIQYEETSVSTMRKDAPSLAQYSWWCSVLRFVLIFARYLKLWLPFVRNFYYSL